MSFLAQVTYTGNGSTTQYSITFPFLDSSHVKAFINGVETTAFTISSSTLTFNSAPANSAVVRIERQTPISSRIVDFTDGSVLTESDLDKSADQNFFVAQEITDVSQSTMKIVTDDKFDAQNKVIKNVANPVNPQDAVTKHYLENTWLSPTDKTNLTTVAGIASNVTTVAGNTTNVNAVAGNNSDITTVATSIANVNNVGNSIANVNTVASSISNVNSIAGIITNINTVGGIASDVTTVAGIASDVTAVAGNNANINTVAGNNSNISTVAGISANVTTVAGVSSNVTTVAGAVTNINTVASNLSGVNSFAERYRVGSSNPTSNNDEGDLFYNSTENRVKFFNGTSFVNIESLTETDPTAIPFSLALG